MWPYDSPTQLGKCTEAELDAKIREHFDAPRQGRVPHLDLAARGWFDIEPSGEPIPSEFTADAATEIGAEEPFTLPDRRRLGVVLLASAAVVVLIALGFVFA